MFILASVHTGPRVAYAVTPATFVASLQKSIAARDADAALQHIDLESAMQDFLHTALPVVSRAIKQGRLIVEPPVSMALGVLGTGNSTVVAAASYFLSGETEKFLRFGVSSGAFAGRLVPKDELYNLDGGSFTDVRLAPYMHCFFTNDRVIEQKQSTALLGAILHIPSFSLSMPVKMRLTKQNGVWRFTGLDDFTPQLEALLGVQ